MYLYIVFPAIKYMSILDFIAMIMVPVVGGQRSSGCRVGRVPRTHQPPPPEMAAILSGVSRHQLSPSSTGILSAPV